MDLNRVKVCPNDLMCFLAFGQTFRQNHTPNTFQIVTHCSGMTLIWKVRQQSIFFYSNAISGGRSGARHFCHLTHSNASCSISFGFEKETKRARQGLECMIYIYAGLCLCLCFTSNNLELCNSVCWISFAAHKRWAQDNVNYTRRHSRKCVAYHLGNVGKVGARTFDGAIAADSISLDYVNWYCSLFWGQSLFLADCLHNSITLQFRMAFRRRTSFRRWNRKIDATVPIRLAIYRWSVFGLYLEDKNSTG